ncbi:MAG: fimbrillin family protein, partial [Bacteroides sp.]|nr:fimbrillin family protein [Bacteroides sp.]
MKKNLLFLASGLIILASCSKDELIEVNNSGNIKFRPAIGAVTRANNITTKENMGSFKVTAYEEGQNNNFFTDLLVRSSEGGQSWNTEKTYYWPTSGTLKFFAYSPQEITSVSINPTTQQISNFSPATNVEDQKDVVISVKTGTKQVNEVSGVNMNFKHILSQIEVQAKCSNENMKVEVKGVKLCHIPSQGTFTFPKEATEQGYELLQNQWGTISTPKDYGIISKSTTTLNETPQNITGSNNFQMIPQQLTPW